MLYRVLFQIRLVRLVPTFRRLKLGVLFSAIIALITHAIISLIGSV